MLDNGKNKRNAKRYFYGFHGLQQSFDSVDHDLLWRDLQELGIPTHLTKLMNNLYTNQEATIRTEFGNTSWFKLEKVYVKAVYYLHIYLIFIRKA